MSLGEINLISFDLQFSKNAFTLDTNVNLIDAEGTICRSKFKKNVTVFQFSVENKK